MAKIARLCNPTPWDVKLPWDKGVMINVPGFGHADLTMQQMDDFRGNKPGSEEVDKVLDFFGLFLLDSDRPYDNQALEALERSLNIKNAELNERINHLRGQRSFAGVKDTDEAFEETLKQMGLTGLRLKVETLKNQINKLKEIVGPERERVLRPQLDPKRTIFVLNPPREFPSIAAMEFFLEQNPEIAAKHKSYQEQAGQTASTSNVNTLESSLHDGASVLKGT